MEMNNLTKGANTMRKVRKYVEEHIPSGFFSIIQRTFAKFTGKHLCQSLFFSDLTA